ncbi:MAG: molybdenum cofactor guanylyltransferase, partial [Finegoldia magna]|nr:molybdenum cofactor guanylyltransferase [Finegoldia magna]
MRVSVGILAGGKSVRMGQDKFDLNFYGHTFIEELINRFKDYEVIVSSNTVDYSPIKTVKDTYVDVGPLSGILEILKNSTTEYVFVTSCDMINVKPDLVDFAASIASFSDEAVIFETDERCYPTCGIFSKKIIPVVEEKLESK